MFNNECWCRTMVNIHDLALQAESVVTIAWPFKMALPRERHMEVLSDTQNSYFEFFRSIWCISWAFNHQHSAFNQHSIIQSSNTRPSLTIHQTWSNQHRNRSVTCFISTTVYSNSLEPFMTWMIPNDRIDNHVSTYWVIFIWIIF